MAPLFAELFDRLAVLNTLTTTRTLVSKSEDKMQLMDSQPVSQPV